MLPSHLPEPELYLADTGEPSLRWGIVGPGWIAGEFAKAVRAHTAQRIVAVSSRSLEHGIELALGTTEELVTHPILATIDEARAQIAASREGDPS